MMIIKLHQISEEPKTFQFVIQRDQFSKLDDRITFDQMRCEATLAKKTDSIALQGRYQVELKTQCDLCLCDISLELEEEFEVLLREEDEAEEPEGDTEITLLSNDVEYFNGQEVILDHYFKDQLLLDLPYSMVCDEDCKGLCSVCGANLNETVCKCDRDSGSHPFSALKDLPLD